MTTRLLERMGFAALLALLSGCASSTSYFDHESEWKTDPIRSSSTNEHAPAEKIASRSDGVADASFTSALATNAPEASSALEEAQAPQQASSSASTTDDMNKSNNPLTDAPGINLQDYYTPSIYHSDAHTNDLLFRGTLPIAPGAIPVPQLIRLTVPFSTRPEENGEYTTGLGDVNVFDILLLGRPNDIDVGVGPLLTIPTSTDDDLGTRKWQAGFAAVAVKPMQEGLLGGLLQWQASFAGPSSAHDVSTLTFQPLAILNLEHGWYLRSTGIWTFDLEHGHYYIPIGVGGGAVWKQGNTVFNAFIEPQFTIAHDGAEPEFTLFFGLNTTLG
jgi:hypothetical protein